MNSWFEKLYDTFIVDDNYKLLFKGFGNTILITLCALLIGIVIGAVIAIAKYYAEGNKKLRIVNWICDIYTTAIRGIPVTVLLMIFYFIIIVSDTTGITTAIIAFGINSGAYMAELIRSGINAVDKGQMEAARSLGMSKGQAMAKIIFPQAIKNILPAIGNEFIAITKETSMASTFFIGDLMTSYLKVNGQTYLALEILIIVGAIYLAVTFVLSKLVLAYERRLNSK